MKTCLCFIIFVVSTLFFSCEKYDLPNENRHGILLKEIVSGDEIIYSYTYTSSDLILEEKSKFHYTKYSYNSRNQVIQSDHYWDEGIYSSNWFTLQETLKRTEWISPQNSERDTYNTYEYNRNGRLEKIVNRTNNNYSSFSYKDGRIVKRTSYHANKASVFDNYSYDDKGNLSKKERYHILANGKSELSTTTEYEFDNKLNPYYSFRNLMIPGKNTNPNNILKETYTLHFEVDDSIAPIQVTEYEYEYNSDGFPVKQSVGWEFIYY